MLSDIRNPVHPVSHLHVCCGIDQFRVLATPPGQSLGLVLEAAIANYHKLSVFNDKNIFSLSSETISSKSRY